MERKNPKLLIIGHARHGKDTFADLLVAKMGLNFVSSSEFVGRRCIWPTWGQERYAAFSDCFEDRVNFRSTWYNLISAYNTPDKARTGTEMMQDFDLYVGMRSSEEFHACMDKALFDHVIWVDGSKRHPLEPKDSMGLTKEMANIWIDNNGPEINMQTAVDNLQKRLHIEGYAVNYTGDIPKVGTAAIIERSTNIPEAKLYSKEMEKIWQEDDEDMDPCDSPTKTEDDPSFSRYQDDPGDLDTEEDEALQKLMDDADENPDQIAKEGYYPPAKAFRMLPENEKWTDNNPGWEHMPEDAIRVLDHGFFKVLSVMGTDQAIADAARMSYGRGTKKSSSTAGLINYLVRNKHTSPLEMAEIKFHIRMPIFVMRQWVRHRTANLNEYSGRYSEMVRLFYVPCNAQICTQDLINKQGSNVPLPEIEANNVGNDMSKICGDAFDVYENLLNRGVARETARMVLPLSTYTEVVWKLDVSNLIKFLTLRDDDHAQWEIRQYATMVGKAVKEYFPLVYAAYQEQRQSQTLTMDEVRALVTGFYDNLSKSQTQKMVLLRYNIEH